MTARHEGVLVSLILVSNRPGNIGGLFDSIEKTATDPARIEVIVKIDDGDRAMAKLMERETKRRKFRLKVLTSPPPESHFTLWKSLNDLHRMCDAGAYFVANLNDEVRFASPGWDGILDAHVGLYPDHIYRLRCSRFRLRNYFDVWECWYAPENFGFHTKRWIDIQGDWNACHVSDSFQQMVAYYLALGSYPSAFQLDRDVPVAGIAMEGQEAAEGLTPDQECAREKGNDRAWYVIMSPKMQTEICRRARLLQAHIWLAAEGHRRFTIRDFPQRRRIEVMGPNGQCLIVYSYHVDEERIARDLAAERARGELFHYRHDINFINETANFLGPVDGEHKGHIHHTSRPPPSDSASPVPTDASRGLFARLRRGWGRAGTG